MPALKILIVEDDAFIAIDLEDQIVAMNHEVVGTAPTARQAVEKARATQPDLALMDLRLANGSSGIEAAMTLRLSLDVPSIIISGSLHEVTAEAETAIRPIAKLSKPLVPSQLRRVICAFALDRDRRGFEGKDQA